MRKANECHPLTCGLDPGAKASVGGVRGAVEADVVDLAPGLDEADELLPQTAAVNVQKYTLSVLNN